MRIRLPADLHAPAAARKFVRAVVGELASDEVSPRTDDLVLAVSELVTNSVRAGASGIDVALALLEDCLELQVSDDAPGWPSAHQAGLDDVDGRGLEIVGKIADEWHTTPLERGKRVTVTWSRMRA